MSVSYGGDKITFDDGTSLSTGYTHFRNRVINGNMRIAQRGTGAVTANTSSSDVFPVDRFNGFVSNSTGAFTQQQSSDVPTGQGFLNSIITTITTVDSSLASGDTCAFRQIIEGHNVSDLEWGTANAKTVTLSFWAKSSVTGLHSGTIANGDWTRGYAFTYTLSSANTWQYVTITIPGATTGTWGNGTDRGIQIVFNLGSGSGRLITAGSWITTPDVSVGATGSVQLISTLNATFYLTGLQFEVGSSATTFERRPYGTELQLCQRYYELIGFGNIAMAESGSTYVMNLNYKVTKRAQPSIGLFTTSNIRVRQFGIADRDAASPSAGSTTGSTNGGYIKVSGFNAIGNSSTPAGIGFTTSAENGDLFFISSEL